MVESLFTFVFVFWVFFFCLCLSSYPFPTKGHEKEREDEERLEILVYFLGMITPLEMEVRTGSVRICEEKFSIQKEDHPFESKGYFCLRDIGFSKLSVPETFHTAEALEFTFTSMLFRE